MPPRHGVQDFAARDEASSVIGTSPEEGASWAPSTQRLDAPVVGGVAVVVQFPLSLPIRPIVVAFAIKAGSATNLVFGDIGPKAAEARIIIQLVPRDGVLIATEAQEPTQGQNRVSHLSGLLVDHEPLDGADAISIAVV